MDFTFDEVVVEDFLFDEGFAIMNGKNLGEFVLFVGVGLTQGVGFEGAARGVFDVFAVKASGAAGGEGFVKKVAEVANDVGLADVGGGDVDGVLEDFEEVAAIGGFFFVAELAVAVNVAMIGADGVEIVFDDFAAAIFARALVGVVGLEFAVAQVHAVDEQGNVRAEGEDLLIEEAVFVGQFLHDGENILVKEV